MCQVKSVKILIQMVSSTQHLLRLKMKRKKCPLYNLHSTFYSIEKGGKKFLPNKNKSENVFNFIDSALWTLSNRFQRLKQKTCLSVFWVRFNMPFQEVGCFFVAEPPCELQWYEDSNRALSLADRVGPGLFMM